MEIELTKNEGPVSLTAKSSEGHLVHIDGSAEVGGQNSGMRPMEVLLSSLAGCASMDVLSILEKQRQQVDSYAVKVHGDRASEVPKVFTHITMTWKLSGLVEEAKLRRAVELSMEKYCSVTAMIAPPATITHVFEISRQA